LSEPVGVRVRFAPSPTGYLHVGGARTAIFNWLFARHHGGVFVLRVEDTDTERGRDELVRAILDGMAWLGMAADEGPHFQSANRQQHVADAMRLLASGRAYRCFCDAKLLAAEREAKEKGGGGYIYGRRCLAIPRAASDARAGAGEPFVVRLSVPPGTTAWDDRVHGRTSFPNDVIEDLILLRSDGSPTYNLSVVSDDVGMRITHVIRGDDHISNTPKQLLIYEGLGKTPPVFAHLPLIFGTDKKRLSKRHGATSVLDYGDAGYLPDAMFNFLALLGWNPGDERQKMTRDELVQAFDLDDVGTSGAVFDVTKLDWLNGLYVAALPEAAFEVAARAALAACGLWDDAFETSRREWFLGVLRLIQPRVKLLAAIPEEGRFFFDPADNFAYDAQGMKKHWGDPAIAAAVGEVAARWDALHDWSPVPLEAELRAVADARGVSAGKLIHPVRLAVTGRTASPGLFEVVALLGRERTRARLGRLLDWPTTGLL
jgi:glutamyl-tRNA synthetase